MVMNEPRFSKYQKPALWTLFHNFHKIPTNTFFPISPTYVDFDRWNYMITCLFVQDNGNILVWPCLLNSPWLIPMRVCQATIRRTHKVKKGRWDTCVFMVLFKRQNTSHPHDYNIDILCEEKQKIEIDLADENRPAEIINKLCTRKTFIIAEQLKDYPQCIFCPSHLLNTHLCILNVDLTKCTVWSFD